MVNERIPSSWQCHIEGFSCRKHSFPVSQDPVESITKWFRDQFLCTKNVLKNWGKTHGKWNESMRGGDKDGATDVPSNFAEVKWWFLRLNESDKVKHLWGMARLWREILSAKIGGTSSFREDSHFRASLYVRVIFFQNILLFFFHDAPMVLHVFLECFHLRCHAIEAVFQKIALERCSSRSAVTSYTGVGSEGARQSRLCLVWLEGRCPTPSYHTFDLELPEDQRHQSMFHMRAAQKHCFKLQPLRDLGSKGSFLPGWAASAID